MSMKTEAIIAAYSSRQVGRTGHEILGPDGNVFCWTIDRYWAELIVALLNGADEGHIVQVAHREL